VVAAAGDRLAWDVMQETLDRSALGRLRTGAAVNLEQAMRLDGRLGGHLVQGHVDATAEVVSREPSEHWDRVTFSLPPRLARYLVAKGSVTVDGVSLTVAELGADTFTVGLVPTTLAQTTLGGRAPGDLVNLEVDVVAKYVERMLTVHRPPTTAPAAPTEGGPR
jgi:riboflavin synthase